MKGTFITFEGCEGAGKSTQIKLLADYLLNEGKSVRTLREPGGTPIGEEIRHILKHSSSGSSMISETELLLMNGSRAQLVGEVILPALNAGEIVLCDRFYDSSVAYQGYGRGLDLTKVYQAINIACSGLKPDLTFLINIKPEDGLRNREKEKTEKGDRFDNEELSFHERVYSGYLEIARKEPKRVKVISYRHGEVDKMKYEIRGQALDLLRKRESLGL